MTAAPIPVGSRVVLVEDHRGGCHTGCKGWRGIITRWNDEYEQIDFMGGCYIHFDNGQAWWVNASAVALESPAPDALTAWERDTALGMALELAKLIDHTARPYLPSGESMEFLLLADWLRDCVTRELWGGGGDDCLPTPFRKVK